jgi:hypothetical protein
MSTQALEFVGKVGTELWLAVLDFGGEFFATVNQRDDVAKVAAAEEVLTATAVERIDLCGQQIGRCYRAYRRARRQPALDSVWDRGALPPILKPEDPGSAGIASRIRSLSRRRHRQMMPSS